MKSQFDTNMKNFMIFLIIILALLSRFIPHPVNMTAIGAAALFAGAVVKSRVIACLLPFFLMLITDLVLGFHNTMFFTYGALTIVVLLSSYVLPEGGSWKSRTLASLMASIVFFLVSNFGVWWVGELYPTTAQGLITSYLMALPFLKNQFLGDLIFTTAVFAIWDWISLNMPSPQRANKPLH